MKLRFLRCPLLHCLSTILLGVLLFSQNTLAANRQPSNNNQPDLLTVMPQVVVEAERVAPTTGTAILDKELIERLPQRNGSINELIGIVPGIQYSEDFNSSYTGGEIFPPPVSISGSRYYENNYTIDGIGNNSALDPASDGTADANKLPGHPQMQFLSPRLIEQVTIYNSNIPAEFGGFTGGQVNSRTLSPTPDSWGQISYRTTNDRWTHFKIHPLNNDKFYHSDDNRYQPKFSKHDFGLVLNTPLNSDTGILSSYQQIYSRIPLSNLGKTIITSRKRENFLVKGDHYLPDNSHLTLTGLYSPTSADYFLGEIKDSEYTLETNNYLLGLEYEKDFNSGTLLLNLGFSNHQLSRSSPKNRYFWSTQTESIDWPDGREGGIGNIESGQREHSIKLSYAFKPISTGPLSHQIKTGFDTTHSRQFYKRRQASYAYYSPVVDASIVCAADDPACIDGEQYLSRRTVYNQAHSIQTVTDGALYLQDSIVWRRLEIFPGVRASYDNFTENLNVAPRFSTALDLFGTGETVLFAGQNRYYSGTLLTQALYGPIVTENQTRTTAGNSASDWSSETIFTYEVDHVDTPYTDETTAGIIQKLFGGELKAQYIKKISKREFARERVSTPDDEPDSYLLINSGRSEHESYQLAWQRSWSRHFFEINATWQETTTTNQDYDDSFSYQELSETIWYDGKELYKYDIPRLDFNRPMVANLIYSVRLPHGITLTNTTKYRGRYWRLYNTGVTRPSEANPDQADPYVYEKKTTHSAVTFDWKITWEIPYRSYSCVFSLDVFNVFDKKLKRSYQSGRYGYQYELGRQIWAGIDLRF